MCVTVVSCVSLFAHLFVFGRFWLRVCCGSRCFVCVCDDCCAFVCNVCICSWWCFFICVRVPLDACGFVCVVWCVFVRVFGLCVACLLVLLFAGACASLLVHLLMLAFISCRASVFDDACASLFV